MIKEDIDLVSWHINLRALFNATAILEEEQLWYYLIHTQGVKKGSCFSPGYSKVNVKERH